MLLGVLPTAACTSEAPLGSIGKIGSTQDAGPRTEVVEATVVRAEGRNTYTVSWDTPEPTDAQLVYGEAQAQDHVVEGTSSDDGLHHEAELLGLAGGVDWQVTATSRSETVLYTTDPLALTADPPPADLPAISMTTEPTDAVSGFAVALLAYEPIPVIALIDREGRYVWWQSAPSIAAYRVLYDAPSHSVVWLAYAGENSTVLWRCALDGQPEVVATLGARTHHDLTPDPKGGWYALAYDEHEVERHDEDRTDGSGDDSTGDDDEEVTVVADQLLHISADGSEVRTVWRSWDEFPYTDEPDPDVTSMDWPHTNSVSVDPETGDVLLSLLRLNTLAMVDPSTGLSVWTMGGDDSDWTFPDGEAFAHQHSPLLVDGDSRLAIFDNGLDDASDPAEAAVYDLDWDTLTATRSWSYDQGGAHTNITTGSAIPVGDAGSVLVSWGSDPTLTQVSASGEVEWQLEFDLRCLGYVSQTTDLGGAAW